jgi:hypothetical protein
MKNQEQKGNNYYTEQTQTQENKIAVIIPCYKWKID